MKLKKPKYTLWIIIAVVVIMLSAMVTTIVLQNTKHNHTFGDWEIFKEPSCSEYGIERRFCSCGDVQEKKIDKTQHIEGEWIVYTETNEKILSCSACGKTLKIETLENHTHSYGEWITTVEPTCTVGGVMTRTCRCGSKEEKAIGTGNHSFGEWEVERESTCVEKGVMSRYCNCGAKEEKDIKLVSHRYGDWKVEYESTCTKNGLKARYCDCGAKDEKELALSEHVFGEWTIIKEAECGVYGIMERVCNCGAKEQKNTHALEHEFSSWSVTKEPTCTGTGIEKRFCKYCQDEETRNISSLGHGNTYSKIVGISVNICCERCNEILDSHRIEDSKNLTINGTTLAGMGTCQDNVVVVPAGVTIIAKNALKGSSITVVVLPDTLSIISDRAFSNCKNLHTIYLESSVTKIEFWAFQYSYNLDSIHYNGTIAQWNAIEKDDEWDFEIGSYTVYCTDGKITK